jgi:hypothetical protein
MDLSALRVAGLIAGVAVISFAFWRRRSLRNGDVIIILLAGIALVIVSATNAADAVLEFFAFRKGGGGRILGLAVFAIFILFALTLRSLWQSGRIDRELSAVLEGIAWEEFRTSGLPDRFRDKVAVVVPAFNEQDSLGQVLARIPSAVCGVETAVLVVDDGSRDATPRIVERETARYRESGIWLRLLGDGANHGKGASVRTGMLEARGRVALFTDADLSAPIEEAPKLIDPIRAGEAAVVIGSRGLDKSMIGVHQPAGRELAGRVFNLVMRLATGLPFKDTQCGFKAFRRDAAHDVFSRVRIERFGFDVEALFVARKLGYGMLEVPVVWNNVEGSKVSFASGINGFLDIARVRANDLRGLYNEPAAAPSVSSVAE